MPQDQVPQITMDIADFAHGIFRGFAEGEISDYDSVEILDQKDVYKRQGHYISRHDDRRNFGRKYRGRAGVCTAWDRQAFDQFGRNKRPSGCGDFDFIHYIRGDFCLFCRGYSLPGDRSENPQESIE